MPPKRHFLWAAAALLLAAAPAAAAKLYVANDALDGPDCGSKASPCRSITAAIARAAPGDTIFVGPGVYGDLDSSGTTGGPGEETGSPGCGCVLSINKPVKLLSTSGAAATLIDGRNVDAQTNVLVIATDVVLGAPGKGFTMTNTSHASATGIAVDGGRVEVRGNQVVSVAAGNAITGILKVEAAGGPILVEANQVIGWLYGIVARGAGATVRGNQVSLNFAGIIAGGTTQVTGNVATRNDYGITLEGNSASAVANGVYANYSQGILLGGTATAFAGTIEKNNVFGNRICGLSNVAGGAAAAPNNYWGAAAGPGADPADPVGGSCDESGAVTSFVPFAARPFRIKAPIKP